MRKTRWGVLVGLIAGLGLAGLPAFAQPAVRGCQVARTYRNQPINSAGNAQGQKGPSGIGALLPFEE